jgi:hypothetical protein
MPAGNSGSAMNPPLSLDLLPKLQLCLHESVYIATISIYPKMNLRTPWQVTPEVNSGKTCHGKNVL